MFEAGDRVRQKNGKVFSNNEHVVTVSRIDGERVWLKETKSWIIDEYIEIDIPSPSPVRTVTRREIVPGTYGPIYVFASSKTHVVIQFIDSSVGETIKSIVLSSEELREAAHILNQLAEALEGKP